MSIEDEIDKVEVIENLDPDGIFQIAKHRGRYFQISTDPNSIRTEYGIFPDNYVFSERLGYEVLCDIVVFLGGKTPEKFRGPVFAHEIAEAAYDINKPKVEAHDQAIQCERIYAERFLVEKTQKEFLEWSRKNAVRPDIK
jgi:hypothetical protein